jgi:uncharacterized membrane protein YqiK
MGAYIILAGIGIFILIVLGVVALLIKWYKKPIHGKALVITGRGGTRVTFDKGIFVIPVLHRMEIMDITLKTITISRTGVDGLICKDNMRADIKVTFFVKVNNTIQDATKVALAIGCDRASYQETLVNLFDAKFSEALKTAGKKFDFVELYTARNEFKKEILQIIGQDLNGYYLDDCAIDYLEQTPLEVLKKNNILDAEGIKKITELTSAQIILANQIEREKEMTITKQDVEARETILALQRQLAEKEEAQKREISNIKDRESAGAKVVSEEQRKISEEAKIATETAIAVAEENKMRDIIIAQLNKQRTDQTEREKVQLDVQLKVNERERIVTLAQIEKEKAVEEERKNIQEVIRERVMVEKNVVTEQEKIKDTQAFAEADRSKRVAITAAEKEAEEALVKQLKAAEAERQAAEFKAKQKLIEADTMQLAALKEAEAQKIMAEAKAAQEAAFGVSEAQVMEAKALAKLKQGQTDASVIELEATAKAKGLELTAVAESKQIELISLAEAKGLQAKAQAEAEQIEKKGKAEAEAIKQKRLVDVEAQRQLGLAEAEVITAKAEAEKRKGVTESEVIQLKLEAEAEGIKAKAESMKVLDLVGKDHEEFKLRLNKDKEVELAQINIQEAIAKAQAEVLGQALKSAKIDIVGGEPMFFDKVIGAVSWGKSIDRFMANNQMATEIKNQLMKLTGLSDSKAEKILKQQNSHKLEEEKIVELNNAIEKQGVSDKIDNIIEEIKSETRAEDESDLPDEVNVNNFKITLKKIVKILNITSRELRDISVSSLLMKLLDKTTDSKIINILEQLVKLAEERNYGALLAKNIGIK